MIAALLLGFAQPASIAACASCLCSGEMPFASVNASNPAFAQRDSAFLVRLQNPPGPIRILHIRKAFVVQDDVISLRPIYSTRR